MQISYVGQTCPLCGNILEDYRTLGGKLLGSHCWENASCPRHRSRGIWQTFIHSLPYAQKAENARRANGQAIKKHTKNKKRYAAMATPDKQDYAYGRADTRVCRWPNAYHCKPGQSLADALSWELQASVERASAGRTDGTLWRGTSQAAEICLEYAPSSVFAAYRGDCYSRRCKNTGKLSPTRGRAYTPAIGAHSYGRGRAGMLAAAKADGGKRQDSHGYLECLLSIGAKPIVAYYDGKDAEIRNLLAIAGVPVASFSEAGFTGYCQEVTE